MRSEKAQDYWRTVQKNKAPLRINRVKFESVRGIGDGEFVFSSTINGICGKNGLGKSTLLKAIALVLDSSNAPQFPEVSERLRGATIDIEVFQNSTDFTVGLGSQHPTLKVLYLDPSELCHVSLDFLRREDNLDELLDQYEIAQLDETSLGEVRRILGRNYSSIEFLEIENLGNYDVLPFFRVRLHGVSYDSRDMALGELSVLYIWWSLWKMLSEPHIVLLEEPENFLTPQAQRYLSDYLAFVAVKSKLWILLSTHSEHVIENVGLQATSVVVENQIDGSVIVKNPRHKMEILEHLGLDPRKKGLILVEDGAGKTVFEQACSYFGSFLLHDYEVVSLNGSGPIKKLLENFPSDSNSVECVGIFDGDEKRNIVDGSLTNCFFLPGTLSPEKTFQTLISADVKSCAAALKISHGLLLEKLSVVIGQDEHDWFDNLRQSLNLDYNTTVRDLSRFWLESEEKAFRALISSLDPSVPSYSQPAEEQNGRSFGKVEHLVRKKGFGFIRTENGETLFFHVSNLEGIQFDELSVSLAVSFEIISTDKKLNKAVSINLV